MNVTPVRPLPRSSGMSGRELCAVDNLERVPVKIATQPKLPSKDEVLQQNYTHHSYRHRCPFCVSGKVDDVAHVPVNDSRSIPVVAVDYAFIGKEGKPIIVRYDEEDRMVLAMAVPQRAA